MGCPPLDGDAMGLRPLGATTGSLFAAAGFIFSKVFNRKVRNQEMIQKVYVSNDNKATFKCPQCGLVKEKDVSKFIKIKSTVKLKCKCVCGHTYPVIFERRRHIRKDVNFVGSFVWGKENGPLFVKNISRTGLNLKMGCPTSLKVGDRFLVKFLLGEDAMSEVEKEVIVRNVRPPMMGVEFVSKDHYGKLGSYMLYDF